MKTILIREGKNGYIVERVFAETLLADTWIFKPNEIDEMLATIKEIIASAKIEEPIIEPWVQKIISKPAIDNGEDKKDEAEN